MLDTHPPSYFTCSLSMEKKLLLSEREESYESLLAVLTIDKWTLPFVNIYVLGAFSHGGTIVCSSVEMVAGTWKQRNAVFLH